MHDRSEGLDSSSTVRRRTVAKIPQPRHKYVVVLEFGSHPFNYSLTWPSPSTSDCQAPYRAQFDRGLCEVSPILGVAVAVLFGTLAEAAEGCFGVAASSSRYRMLGLPGMLQSGSAPEKVRPSSCKVLKAEAAKAQNPKTIPTP